MINSMTGFGSSGVGVVSTGKCCVEIRSINHKFLETTLHIPDSLSSLEDKIKKEIESRIRRGRVSCVINLNGVSASEAIVDEVLLKKYLGSISEIKKKFKVQDQVSINTLLNLPGVLSLNVNNESVNRIWPQLKKLIDAALDNLLRTRVKEGRSMHHYLRSCVNILDKQLKFVEQRFKKASKEKAATFKTSEEQAAFLKNADIFEEMSRLGFHIRNFKSKLNKSSPLGKELDFITQEMQRESNTIGAKSFDAMVSGKVVDMKSQIEKIREQVQNIE